MGIIIIIFINGIDDSGLKHLHFSHFKALVLTRSIRQWCSGTGAVRNGAPVDIFSCGSKGNGAPVEKVKHCY